MNDRLVNRRRRKFLQSAACVGTASVAPGVFGSALLTNSETALSGELVCSIWNPVKTLVLYNHSAEAIVIEQVRHGALMFDGSIVDCNSACATKPITIPAHQKVQIRFDKRQQSTLTGIEEINRIQPRVTRLNDGTRVVPFEATVHRNVATLI